MKRLQNLVRQPWRWLEQSTALKSDAAPSREEHAGSGPPSAAAGGAPPSRLRALPRANVTEFDAGKTLAAVAASNARFQSLTLLGSDWHWDIDANFRFTAISGNLDDPIGATIARNLERPLWQMPQIATLRGGWSEHRRILRAHEVFRDFVLRAPRQEGGFSYVSISGEPVFGEDGAFLGYRGVGLDITKQKLIEANISRLARFDPLTGLHNRTAFFERLDHALAVAARHDRKVALLFVDLDRFKDVNDAFGHISGDDVLKALALRLSKAVRGTDTVGRLGGDEFIVLAEDVSNQVDVNEFGTRLLQALSEPVVVHGQECRLGASIGVAMYPDDGEDATTLLRTADAAMYRSKESGGNNLAFAAEVQGRPATERMMLGAALRRALELNQFHLLYQPKISVRDGTLTGVEALVRWQHPEHGEVLPGTFIPLAEESGLIRHIDRWVLHQACLQGCRWRDELPEPVRVAVNLSARQFMDGGLVIEVAHALAQTGLPPDLLELEITESMMMAQPERAAETLLEIREMGVHLAIDDFGTGYSSLARLKKFPIGSVKIDRSFIGDIADDPDAAAIVSAVIAMAHNLRLRVVAEGVETEQQVQFLCERKCDEVQGYLISKPIDAGKVDEFALRNMAARRGLVAAE
ncbi:MAG TPA: EAL domain-containing protein [Casimicrobiaceae bacterium]|nr:EAL domain-containing protein [Casimicrobiaceae bacterium]